MLERKEWVVPGPSTTTLVIPLRRWRIVGSDGSVIGTFRRRADMEIGWKAVVKDRS